MALSREEKIAKARELRAEGRTSGQIALALGSPASTVRNWYLGGNCEVCGAALDGSRGSNSPTLCAKHAAAGVRSRTKERAIAEIQRWVAEFGRAPSAMDWNPYAVERHPTLTEETKQRKIERHRAGGWPWASLVTNAFGSWSAGLKAAGLESNPTGGAGRWEAGQVAA